MLVESSDLAHRELDGGIDATPGDVGELQVGERQRSTRTDRVSGVAHIDGLTAEGGARGDGDVEQAAGVAEQYDGGNVIGHARWQRIIEDPVGHSGTE